MKNPVYATTDFAVASYLRAAGVPMTGTRRDGPRVVFLFDDSVELKGELRDYFTGKALISPQAMTAAIRELKTLIHNAP